MSFVPQPQPEPRPTVPPVDRQTAYDAEVRRYRERTPRALEAWEEARRYLPLGVCSNFRALEPHPFFMSRAQGSRLVDVDGNEYVDWAMAQSTLLAGHSHPAVVAAVREQAARGTICCFPNPLTARLAKVVCERFRLEQVRFVNTGTEATQYAARVARRATGRDKVVKFDICYHGAAAEYMIGRGDHDVPEGTPEWMTQDVWTEGVPRAYLSETVVADYNDLDSVRAVFSRYPRSIAAVIVEPVALNSNILLPRERFLQGLRRICDQEGAVLIYDEVKVGCKLGPLGAGEYFGVPADLVCMAKAIGGGIPIGLFGGRRDLMREIESGGVKHVGTNAANPLALAAAYATLTEVLTPQAYERVFEINRALCEGYQEIIDRLGLDAHVVRLGACGSLVLSRRPIHTRRDFQRTRLAAWPTFWLGMLNRGVIPQGYSPEDMWTASVQHTPEDVERSLRAFREVAPLLA
jgi:glutamate-1-semialdehyde 2,1-aminomutase